MRPHAAISLVLACFLVVACGGTVTVAGAGPSPDPGSSEPVGAGGDPAAHPVRCLDSQPVALATGEDFPVSIAVDDSRVYWTNWTDPDFGSPPNTTTLRSIAKTGGSVATLDSLSHFRPSSLHVDAGFLYFYRSTIGGLPLDSAGIMRVCKDGSCPLQRVFGPGEDNAVSLTIDRGSIYFHDDHLGPSGTGVLARIDKNGGKVAGVASDYTMGGYMYTVAADDDHLYALASRAPKPTMLVRFGKDSSGPEILGFGTYVAMAVDASYVFVSDYNPGSTPRLLRIPKHGGAAVTIAEPAAAAAIFLDADRVYWLDSGVASPTATLNSVGKDGSGRTSLSMNENIDPSVAAMDDACLYWVAGNGPQKGSIMTVAKPKP